MADEELAFKHPGHGLLNRWPSRTPAGHPNVKQQAAIPRGDRPSMEVVNVEDARHLPDRLRHLGNVQTLRGRFHQDVDGLGQDAPGTPQDQSTDHQGNQRVGDVVPWRRPRPRGHHAEADRASPSMWR